MPVGTKKDAKRNGSLVFCMIRVESMINLKILFLLGFDFPHKIRK